MNVGNKKKTLRLNIQMIQRNKVISVVFLLLNLGKLRQHLASVDSYLFHTKELKQSPSILRKDLKWSLFKSMDEQG